MDALAPVIDHLASAAPCWAFAFAFMTALELLLPRSRTSIRGRLSGLLFWAIFLPVNALGLALFREIWALIGIHPLITLPLTMSWTGALAWIAAPIAGAVVGDFFFYWFHRAQHRWFWRYHAVHHSIRELSAVNAFHHISEPIFYSLLFIIPTSLILSDTGPVAPLMTVILFLHSSYIHSPAAIDFGPLRSALVDNRFHRIHHSLEEKHFDHNFGAFTTIWDRLFRTAWFPAKDEWPDTGLAEVDQPRTVGEWLTLPGRYDAGSVVDPLADEVPA
ncbi:sterol desaturase family protein [Sphingomonas sp. G-3-2-10]|uniref:sterol desaturase family protein n=1 Tax=Sphingomonas sp. G-3-2-10 TaxID=2728838 RepID=UPI00146BB8B7|nr:sterol desaturase family protein [Sphingomonas sp. G-3-2-10]NML04955.1 sterol desaturase family protein [Sphingomonas sp. G-3-2-10]